MYFQKSNQSLALRARIERLNLSNDIVNVLEQAKILSVSDLAGKTKGELLLQWGMNSRKINEIESKLENYFANYELKKDEFPFFVGHAFLRGRETIKRAKKSSQSKSSPCENTQPRILEMEEPAESVLTNSDSHELLSSSNHPTAQLDAKIEVLGLSARPYHCLKRANLKTIGDVLAHNDGDLSSIHNLGPKSLKEIHERLQDYKMGRLPVTSQAIAEIAPLQDPVAEWGVQLATLELEIEQGRLTKQLKCYTYSLDELIRTGSTLSADQRELLEYELKYHLKFSTLNQELHVLTNTLSPREFLVILSRYGFSPKTLQEIADDLHLTRERVRQIQRRASHRIAQALERNDFWRLETALFHARQLGLQFSLAKWERLLVEKNLVSETSFMLKAPTEEPQNIIQVVIAILQANAESDEPTTRFQLPEQIQSVLENPSLTVEQNRLAKQFPVKELRRVRRECRNAGAVSIYLISRRLKVSTLTVAMALQAHGYEPITKEWLVKDPPKSEGISVHISAFQVNVIKMLNICGPLSVDSIREGLDNHISRFEMSAPPVSVLRQVLGRYGFEINAKSMVVDFPSANISFSEGERAFFHLVQTKGPVINFHEISQEFELRKLSTALLPVTLRYSVIVQRIDQGLYILRGTNFNRQDVEAANTRRPVIEQDSTLHFSSDGTITYEINVGIYGKHGTFPVGEAKRLAGEWQVVDKNIDLGQVQVGDTRIWGLEKAMKHHRIQLGDRIALRFNPEMRTIQISKVDRDAI
ncbi:MAG: hypothetical protein B6D41_00815 [Chloroflexi bacterium UTCFX4]|jgi:DNA-binding CsgD family transcriptional regulator|nr:MAG: hypothetical protein B6D41_00815 [Chloroflexi bacterium UTCFX4]